MPIIDKESKEEYLSYLEKIIKAIETENLPDLQLALAEIKEIKNEIDKTSIYTKIQKKISTYEIKNTEKSSEDFSKNIILLYQMLSLTLQYYIPEEERTSDNKLLTILKLANLYISKKPSSSIGMAYCTIAIFISSIKKSFHYPEKYNELINFLYSSLSSLATAIKNIPKYISEEERKKIEEIIWAKTIQNIKAAGNIINSYTMQQIAKVPDKTAYDTELFDFAEFQFCSVFFNLKSLVYQIISKKINIDDETKKTDSDVENYSVMLVRILQAIQDVDISNLTAALTKIREINNIADQQDILNQINVITDSYKRSDSVKEISFDEETEEKAWEENLTPEQKEKIYTLNKMLPLVILYFLPEKERLPDNKIFKLLQLGYDAINENPASLKGEVFCFIYNIIRMFELQFEKKETHEELVKFLYHFIIDFSNYLEKITNKLDLNTRIQFKEETWESINDKLIEMSKDISSIRRELRRGDSDLDNDVLNYVKLIYSSFFQRYQDGLTLKADSLFKLQEATSHREKLDKSSVTDIDTSKLNSRSKKLEEAKEKEEKRIFATRSSSDFFRSFKSTTGKIEKSKQKHKSVRDSSLEPKKIVYEEKSEPFSSALSDTLPPTELSLDIIHKETEKLIMDKLTFYLITFKYGGKPTYVAFSPDMDSDYIQDILKKVTEGGVGHSIDLIDRTEKKLRGYDLKVRFTSGIHEQERVLAKQIDLDKLTVRPTKEGDLPSSGFSLFIFDAIASKKDNTPKGITTFSNPIETALKATAKEPEKIPKRKR